MLETLGQDLLNKVNFDYDDRPGYWPGLIKNPSQYITWKDVEDCINRPELWDFEIIDEYNNKVNIPSSKKVWQYIGETQDKAFLANAVNSGQTAVITNYGFKNDYTNHLLHTFEQIFNVHAAIHVYCGLSGGKSFSIHDDYPANFIIQADGETHWKVFNNRISYLYGTGRMNGKLTDDMLDVAIDVVLKPGDVLYIPARTFHVAYPDSKRISMSIPCWNKLKTDLPSYATDRIRYKINYE
jgi:Cupin superfamily protein